MYVQIIMTNVIDCCKHNNKDKKFELKIYETSLTHNMSEKILSDIILFFQNLN